jgi:phospholipase C
MVGMKVLLRCGLITIGAVVLGTLDGCGGGGASSVGSSGNSGPPPEIYMSFQNPPPSMVQTNKTVKVSAAVSFDNSNAGVDWKCSPVGACGSFSPKHTASLATATYTAPSSPGSGPVTISGTATADSTKSVSAQALITPIQHVVVIFQENRSPDNLFQDPNLISAGADIVNVGIDHLGQQIPLTPRALGVGYDLDHSHTAFVTQYDNGKMDGADLNSGTCVGKCPPYPEFASVEPSQLGPYFQMAEQYTFTDHMFQTNQSDSFPAHQYIIAGTPALSANSPLLLSGNPFGPAGVGNNAGCTGPSQEVAPFINLTTGGFTSEYPCLEHPTLTDLLDSNQISWRYYTPNPTFLWTAPNAIKHMCVPQSVNGNLVCTGSDWNTSIILNNTQVLTDIADGQLAGVTWVIPDGRTSDHPQETDGSGPSWVASIVNAVGNSPYWQNTTILILWDDWGGFYDHVPPFKIRNFYEYGFRVPMIVVSPYAKTAYISHVPHHFGSILKYIEETFDLPSIGASVRMQYADAYPDTDDLSDCFDYGQVPQAFQAIQAPLGPEHFLRDKRPPLPPDND